ncbi:MAG: DUF6364 family protein [Pseudomonadota bacterium]|nr:DUF6364 family protein [Pseudomonadota bacterium]
MRAAKLTLSVDPKVIEAAKEYAAETGTSVSQLVEDFLAAVASRNAASIATPVLSRLRGSLRGAEVQDYRDHLAEKYQCAEPSST